MQPMRETFDTFAFQTEASISIPLSIWSAHGFLRGDFRQEVIGHDYEQTAEPAESLIVCKKKLIM